MDQKDKGRGKGTLRMIGIGLVVFVGFQLLPEGYRPRDLKTYARSFRECRQEQIAENDEPAYEFLMLASTGTEYAKSAASAMKEAEATVRRYGNAPRTFGVIFANLDVYVRYLDHLALTKQRLEGLSTREQKEAEARIECSLDQWEEAILAAKASAIALKKTMHAQGGGFMDEFNRLRLKGERTSRR